MSTAKEELVSRLVEGKLPFELAEKYAARFEYLAARYTKLAVMASVGHYDQEDMDAAKEMLRERVWEQVGDLNRERLEALDFTEDLLLIQNVDFAFDPREATVRLSLASGSSNRMDGTWGITVSDEAVEGLDGDILLDALNWRENLKDRLAVHGQDPQHLEGVIGKMQVEKVTSLDDSEIERAFENTVLSGFCTRYAKAARDCGLDINDLYPTTQMDIEIQELSVDDSPSPM